MGLFDVVGDILGTNKTGDAVAAQTAGANAADATQMEMFNKVEADQAPYRQAGYSALSSMQDPRFQKSFTMADFQEDPGYQFALNEGQKALERGAAAKGMSLSGGQLKALTNYNQGMANQQYQNAYERYNNDLSTQYNRLASLAGLGQTANNTTSSAAMSAGQGIAQTQAGLGNANAAAYMNQGKQNMDLLNQGVGAAFLFCDRRLKTDIRPLDEREVAELKACIMPFRFRYKNWEKHGKGEFLGVMTDDLKKSKLGRELITIDHEGNEVIDVNRTLMLFLAWLGTEA